MSKKSFNLYTLFVWLVQGPIQDEYAGKEISRTIQIKGTQSLSTLHNAIFKAFERYDQHLYGFYVPKKRYEYNAIDYPFDRETYDAYSPQPSDELDEKSARVRIDSLNLKTHERFAYLFDFGDEWGHVIEVESVEQSAGRAKFPKVIKKKGKAPPQYEDEYVEEGGWVFVED